jgi:hypothetical protein
LDEEPRFHGISAPLCKWQASPLTEKHCRQNRADGEAARSRP